MVTASLRRTSIALLGLVVMTLACADRGEQGDAVGSVGLALQVVPGVTLSSVSYAITGPGGFARSGAIDTSHSATVSAVISNLPTGAGFSIALNSTSSDGNLQCAGSASFAVAAHTTTSVTVHLLCHEAPKTSGILVNGTLSVCATVDGLSASPAEVVVGGAIALAGSAHDADAAPAALTYHWTASAGTLSDAGAQNPSLTCTGAGAVTVTLAVNDGDCGDTLSTTVTCTGVAHVVINEVESNGDPVGDWTELYNSGTATADVSGWKFKDNDDSHAFYVIPTGTLIPPGGFYVMNVAQFSFGLGAPDSTRLFDPAGNLVDSYSWSTHAAGTYGRCPDGTGAFVDAAPTKGAPNSCGGADAGAGSMGSDAAAGGGGAADAGGASGAGGTGGLAGNELPWPGADNVVTVDELNFFGPNLSGLSYQPAAGADPSVLWAVQNGPSKLYRLLWNGVTWSTDAADNWGAGKLLHYTDGTGAPDSEGVGKAEWTDSGIYVSTERDNNVSGVSRLSVLRFDTTAAGAELTALNDWNLTADLPVAGANLGLEAITYVPDTALVAGGFFDEATHAAYSPGTYPNHGTGLFFVGLEANGSVYGYALDHVTNGFTRVATFASGQVSIMDLAYDREVGYLWGYCDNTCGNKATVFRLDTGAMSPTAGRFQISRVFDHPSTLPSSNNEGITFAPESECVGGQKSFFWTDDDAINGHSIRRGAIPCGSFF